MMREFSVYVFRGEGHISAASVDELLRALEQIQQAGIDQEQDSCSDHATLYAFLQVLKRTMQTSPSAVKRNGFQADFISSR